MYRLLTALFAAFLIVGCQTTPSHAQDEATVNLVGTAKYGWHLALPAEPNDWEKKAGEEYNAWMARVARPEATTIAPGPNLPIVIRSVSVEEAPEALRGVKVPEGAFQLTVKPTGIEIVGIGEGALFGVYELLEQAGFRWFMPGELGTVIPEGDLPVRLQVTVQSPSFVGRHFQMPDVDWQTRLRCGGPTFPAAHGFPGYAGAAGKKLFAEHPEYFSLVNGQRVMRQACVSNPGGVAHVIEQTKAYFRRYPDREVMGIGPNDGAGFCECENCRALDGGDYDAFSGEASVTDRYVWFFNQVLDGIADEFPDKKLGFYVYHTYMRPPVKQKPNPRITGALAPIALCRVHGPNNPLCPEKQYYQWLASEWGKLIPELWERGYWSNLACPGFPFIIVHRLREQIPFGFDAGIYGWRVETFPHYGTQLPSQYIAGKLMWNHQADVEALLADFYAKFFGPASGTMGEYIALMDAALRDADFHTGCSWDMAHFYPPAVRAQAATLLAEGAKQAPKGSVYADRVLMIQQTYDFLIGFIDMMEARNRVDLVAAQEGLTRLDAAAAKLLEYDPPMVGKTMYESYMRRFYRSCTEQGYARVTGGNRLVAACPEEWDFQLDPTHVGMDLGYFKPGVVGPNWQRLHTSSLSWSDQGLRYYKGLAWYRCQVDIPADAIGERTFLWCGGIDEVAKVWINGQEIGNSHAAAMYPFELDATAAVKPGRNTIVFCVSNERVNELGTGGILAPVILYAPAAGKDATLENIRDPRPTFP